MPTCLPCHLSTHSHTSPITHQPMQVPHMPPPVPPTTHSNPTDPPILPICSHELHLPAHRTIPSVHHRLTRMPPSHVLIHSFIRASIHSSSLSRSGRGSHKSAYKALWGALPGSSNLPPSPFSPAERVIPALFPFVCQPLLSSRLAGDHKVLPHLPLPLVVSETAPV